MPALRQISATGVLSFPCFRMNAFCASVNFDAFMRFRSSSSQESSAGNYSFKRYSFQGAEQHRYVWLYNQQLPQSTLGSKTPLQAMKD
jgi:hypothetical protein